MSGRYAQELVAAGFAVEVADAPLLHDGLNTADLAHLLVLVERGVVPARVVPGLAAALVEADRTPAGDFGYDARDGEVYNCREKRFAAAIGRDAGWLHAGRPRREAVRIALRLRVRRDLCDLLEAAAELVLAGARTATDHAATLMVEQTYLQHAQPSTFGHYLLGMVAPVLRDIERLSADLEGVDRSPAGAGAVNGSPLTGDRAHLARLLGFADVIEHTRDAMWQSDGWTALVGHAAGLATTLDRLAEDLEIWSSAEFGWVRLALGHTRTSVLMPQKRNPYALTMIRGEAGVLVGRATGMLALAKSPSARSDNLIFAYGEVPRALDLATRATRLTAGVVAELEVDTAAMEAALRGGFSQASDLAEHLMVTVGLDYRSAYDVVGGAVRRAAAEGLTGADIGREHLLAAAGEAGVDPAELAALRTDHLTDVLDPARIVRSRDSRGGAAPEEVRRMAAAMTAEAEKARDAAQARRAGFDVAEAALRRRVAALAAPPTTETAHDPDGDRWTSATSTPTSPSGTP